MKRVDLLEEYNELSSLECGVLKPDSTKSFLAEIYPPNDSIVNWLITAVSPSVGLSLGVLLPIIGVNVATISAGGIAGLFGATVLSGPILAPFLVAAVGIITTGFAISRKANKSKTSTASPEDLLCHQTLSTLYIPIIYFARKGNLDRNIEYYEKIIKEKFIKIGCTEEYINKYFSFIKKTNDEELLEIINKIIRVSVQLQNEMPFKGKLYKKDFKENYLIKMSKDICNSWNDEFCSNLLQKSENENDINNFFDEIVNISKNELDIQNKLKKFEENYDKQTEELEKKLKKEFDDKLKTIKNKMTEEFLRKFNSEKQKIEEEQNNSLEELKISRNKDNEKSKYEEELRRNNQS